MKGSPMPGYIAIKPIEMTAEIAPGLVDITKSGFDPNGKVVMIGDLSEYPNFQKKIKVGVHVLVPKHNLQVFKFEQENLAIVHVTDVRFVFTK